jgi:hypothetical protein
MDEPEIIMSVKQPEGLDGSVLNMEDRPRRA